MPFTVTCLVKNIRNDQSPGQKAMPVTEIAARESATQTSAEEGDERRRSCLHESTVIEEVTRVTGCKIDDTRCVACKKVLCRTWSTAYETDPKDHISDWSWYQRECALLYENFVPDIKNYVIVEKVD